MIGMTVDLAKKNFFDPKKILDKAERAQYRTLLKAGAFTRRKYKNLIRNKKKTSTPGQPPSGHPAKGEKEGKLESLCFFVYDQARKSVVVGPALLNSPSRTARPVSGTVPNVLEQGGEIQILEVFRRGVWTQARKLRGDNAPTRFRRVTIAARPAIGPALAAEAPKFPELFRKAIT